MKKRGRKLGSGKGRQVITRSISMLPWQWQSIDERRGRLSRGKWLSERIFVQHQRMAAERAAHEAEMQRLAAARNADAQAQAEAEARAAEARRAQEEATRRAQESQAEQERAAAAAAADHLTEQTDRMMTERPTPITNAVHIETLIHETFNTPLGETGDYEGHSVIRTVNGGWWYADEVDPPDEVVEQHAEIVHRVNSYPALERELAEAKFDLQFRRDLYALQSKELAEAREQLEDLEVEATNAINDIVRVKYQRDTLAEALEMVTTHNPVDNQCDNGYSPRYVAKQALAAVKGGSDD